MLNAVKLPPPAPGPQSRHAYAEEAAHLRAHPQEWFTIRKADTQAAAWGMAAAIKRGQKAAFRPANEFEVYTHDTEVNARYIGPGGAKHE